MFGFGNTKTDRTYAYHMVISLDNEPRNKVRDVRGEFTLDDGETAEDAKEKIVAECQSQLGVGFFVVSFSYK